MNKVYFQCFLVVTEREKRALAIQRAIGRKLQDRIDAQNAAVEKAKQREEARN